MSADPISHVRVLAQTDPTANRMRQFGDDLRHAKALVADLESVLKRLDDESAALTEAGVRMTYTLGPIGDAAAAARRDLNAPHTFDRPNRNPPPPPAKPKPPRYTA